MMTNCCSPGAGRTKHSRFGRGVAVLAPKFGSEGYLSVTFVCIRHVPLTETAASAECSLVARAASRPDQYDTHGRLQSSRKFHQIGNMMAGKQFTDAGAGRCQDSKLFTQRAVNANGKFGIVVLLTARLIALGYGRVFVDCWIRK